VENELQMSSSQSRLTSSLGSVDGQLARARHVATVFVSKKFAPRRALSGGIRHLVAAAVLAGCAHAPIAPIAPVAHVEAVLRADDGLACEAYVVAQHEPVTDVFLWMGGTGTGTSARLPDDLAEFVRSRAVAFVTFDKPGVHATFGDPASVRIDDGPFQRHTQGTLIACAKRALALARQRFGPAVRVHLHGHSEGALIALYVLDELGPADAAHVSSLVLSGLPLEPFDELVRRQVAGHPVLARAIAACDWVAMRPTGVSCAYLRDAGARPSGRAMFERFATRAPAARFIVFAGSDDTNTPARFVHDLEAWNARDGHLALDVHDYEGAHHGTAASRREMAEVLAGMLAR